jgi:hypothetical protein
LDCDSPFAKHHRFHARCSAVPIGEKAQKGSCLYSCRTRASISLRHTC